MCSVVAVADPPVSDSALALSLARAAGAELLAVRALRAGEPRQVIKDAGDEASQSLLARLLAQARPGDEVLSEEAPDNPARLGARRVWIIDPLDGTREFAEVGRDDWAVHVALWASGDLVAGAVAVPATGDEYGTEVPPVLRPRRPGPLRIAVSRSRPPAFVRELAQGLGAELIAMGSAGVKAMSVVNGQADAYLHAGGQYEWDSAAPVAVARATGLLTSRLDGGALEYNRPDPLLPDLLISRPEYAPALLEAVRKLS